jgi:hypothetical protein
MRPSARVRVGQFFAALDARRRPPADGPARRVLSGELFELFTRMSPEDRRHGLEVLSILESDGETDVPLLQAALLHDVGKAEAGVGLPHRILRVLLARRFPRVWAWLAGWPTGWRRPFWVVTHHPERGAIWVETRGADPAVVELIRYHESPAPGEWAGTPLGRWHEALGRADATC